MTIRPHGDPVSDLVNILTIGVLIVLVVTVIVAAVLP